MSQGGADEETVAAYTVAATLKPSKKDEGDEWWRYVASYSAYTHIIANSHHK